MKMKNNRRLATFVSIRISSINNSRIWYILNVLIWHSSNALRNAKINRNSNFNDNSLTSFYSHEIRPVGYRIRHRRLFAVLCVLAVLVRASGRFSSFLHLFVNGFSFSSCSWCRFRLSFHICLALHRKNIIKLGRRGLFLLAAFTLWGKNKGEMPKTFTMKMEKLKRKKTSGTKKYSGFESITHWPTETVEFKWRNQNTRQPENRQTECLGVTAKRRQSSYISRSRVTMWWTCVLSSLFAMCLMYCTEYEWMKRISGSWHGLGAWFESVLQVCVTWMQHFIYLCRNGDSNAFSVFYKNKFIRTSWRWMRPDTFRIFLILFSREKPHKSKEKQKLFSRFSL